MTDVRLRITKIERHEGFYTANVTVAGMDTVRVDTAIGLWTIPVNPRVRPGDRTVMRREVLPQFAALLWKRVRAFERGERREEDDVASANGRPDPAPTKTVAARMADAALEAVKAAA